MAAHLVTSGDIATYGAQFPTMQLNDLIDDANENTTDLGSFHNMVADFPGFRAGGTIWLKNTAQGRRQSHRFTGNGTNWGGGSASSMNKVRVLDQNFYLKDQRNTNTYLFEFENVQHIDVSGFHSNFKGLRDPNIGAYPEQKFGIVLTKDGFSGEGTNMVSLKGDLKNVRISDMFVRDGFAKIRVQPDDTSILDSMYVHRVWGEGGSGEILYLNKTNGTGGQTPLCKNYYVSDCVAFWAGAEGFQLQDLMQGTYKNLIENNLILYSARDWKAPFLAAQGGGFQLRYNEGGIIVRNAIIWGWGANGLNLQFNSRGNPAVNNGQIKFENVLFVDGHDKCVLLNTSDANCEIDFDRCHFGHIQETYASIGQTQSLEQINVFGLIQDVIRNSRHKSSRTFYKEEEIGYAVNTQDVNNTPVAEVERPEFQNLGFTEEPYKCLNWNWETSDGTPSPGLPIQFNAGDISRFKIMEEVFTVDTATNEIIKANHGYSNGQPMFFKTTGAAPAPLDTADLYYLVGVTTNRFQIAATFGGPAIDLTTAGTGVHKFWIINNPNYGRYYKSNTAHSSTEATRPDRDPVNWTVLGWDSNYVRSDKPGFNGTIATYIPPRVPFLVPGSLYEALGERMGLSNNPTNFTSIQWQESEDNGVTWTNIDLAIGRRHEFRFQEINYPITGKRFRPELKFRTIDGQVITVLGDPSAVM